MLKRLLALAVTTGLALPAFSAEKQPDNIISIPEGPYYSPFIVVVDKLNRKTSVWRAGEKSSSKVAEYVSDQGKNDGDKKALGDHKTPEGVYFFQERYEGESLDYSLYGMRAFTTNYPNLFDKRDGKTGSGIWLHAIPDTESLERGSRGCVVLRNKAILEISDYISVGKTPIVINNSINFENPEDIQATREKIKSLITNWKKSWVEKDLETYMTYYSKSNFESLKMNWDKWKTFKAGLNEKYQEISVEFSEPVILKHKGDYIVRVLQRYQSDKHEDFGEKTLFIRTENGEPKIIAETWENKADNSQAISQFDIERPGQRKVSSAEANNSSLQN